MSLIFLGKRILLLLFIQIIGFFRPFRILPSQLLANLLKPFLSPLVPLLCLHLLPRQFIYLVLCARYRPHHDLILIILIFKAHHLVIFLVLHEFGSLHDFDCVKALLMRI